VIAAVGGVEILRELVAIPTPSVVSNRPLLRWVAEFLEPRGWSMEWFEWSDEAGVAKANLIAWPGAGVMEKVIDLAFVCHTDTVPYAENWPGALTLEERHEHLNGCGSCDVKGALACFLAAVSAVDFKDISRRITLILTADEEIGCKGMERLLAVETFRNLRIRSAIVSEPTSLRPGIAGKGYGMARITVEGREAHSAFPGQGVSAISVAARLIARIEDSFAAEKAGPDSELNALFDPPYTTVNIGVISGGTAKNILAGSCGFLVEWRAVPGEEAGYVLGRIHALAGEAQRAEPRSGIRVEGLRDELGFAPAASGPLRGGLSSLLGGEPAGISFGSEASRLARIADEVIVIGPGDMRTAHSDRECVPVVELELWTRTLRELITAR
jgi:acetylornithine deacetylase